MALMRLFTGLDLHGDVVRNLEALLDRLRPAARIQWSPAANLHITTKFVGEWPEERLPELQAALAELPERPAIQVAVAKVGFYPHARAPRIFCCGIDAPGLTALAADTELVTAALGVARENRTYSPHLTLARIKDQADLRRLREALAAMEPLDFGQFAARSSFLYQSHLRATGSVYTKLSEFPFSRQ